MTFSRSICLLFVFSWVYPLLGQEMYLEGGVSLGNVLGTRHAQGKAALHLGVIRTMNFGELGLEFSSGGNFIPGTNSEEFIAFERLSGYDTRFTSIQFLYRYFPLKAFFVEPRLGYTSLNAFVHALNQRKIERPNFSYGLAMGWLIDPIIISLQYQRLGRTARFNGIANGRMLEAVPEEISLLMLRLTYRLNIEHLF